MNDDCRPRVVGAGRHLKYGAVGALLVIKTPREAFEEYIKNISRQSGMDSRSSTGTSVPTRGATNLWQRIGFRVFLYFVVVIDGQLTLPEQFHLRLFHVFLQPLVLDEYLFPQLVRGWQRDSLLQL